jgi:aspartyl/asparaginyl beta-hydroxylase (cupin superfamily)
MPSPPNLDKAAQKAVEALRRGDARTARDLFLRATAETPRDVGAWYGLALACLEIGDEAAALDALDHVLALEPTHLSALSIKADYFAKLGDDRAAEAFYRAVVAHAPDPQHARPAIQDMVRRAQGRCAEYTRRYETHLLGAVAQSGFKAGASSHRFGHSLNLLLGKSQIYLQSPTSYYFPELPQRSFYEREEFPWIAALEAQTDVIRDELLGVVGDDAAFRPYVRSDGARPPRDIGGLRDNLAWSAFYLIENGAIVPAAAARCPKTLAAVESTPLCKARGATPSVLFSLLRPGARIPPHTGHNNARLICHLPLIVPGGCGLRVGHETRAWAPGETLIFDDSMEHEAWNDSGEIRVVLLFDVWRPELTLEERDLVAATLTAVSDYGGAPPG